MLKFLPAKVRNLARSNPTAARYVVDGLLVACGINMAASNVNLLAIRLGADDFQLSLIQFLPQMCTLMVLIPGGLFMDSLRNKKRIVIITLAAIMLGYLLCSVSPFAASLSIPFFLVSLSLAGSAMALYNIAWQSFFPNVIEQRMRNMVLTLRTRVTLLMTMLMPVLVGLVLTRIGAVNLKILAHQSFFFISVLLFLLTAFNFRKFRTSRPVTPKQVSLTEINEAFKKLLHNKPFLLFAGTILFFHMTWHFDWTLYFIGQVNYLQMNEFQVGLVPVGAAVVQLLTLRFWSRKNEQHGVVLPFTFGIIGLSLCPVSMIIAVSLPSSIGAHLFIIMHMIAHIPFCVITLNLFQCILQVTDNENVSFSMSVIACLICLSNAIMPVLGVALYHSLGGSIDGFRYTFVIIFALRIVATLLWILRWRYQSKMTLIS